MADSNNPRSHRAYDLQQFPGGAEGDQRGGDPLAELARLIGQSDPFVDFERNRASGDAQSSAPAPVAPQRDLPPEPPQEAYLHASDAAPAYVHAAAAPQDMAPQAYPQQQYPAEGYAQYPEQAYGYPADPYQQGHQPYYDPYYDADGSLDETEYHEQQNRGRRRARLVAVIAILALAVLGGAGAYGYRTFFGPAMQASPPPVIKADTTPTKVIPAAQASDAGSNKLIYDRVGERAQVEKMVPREEKPIDIKTAAVTQPRAVYPAMDGNTVPAPPTATIPVMGQRPAGQVLPVASAPSMATQGSGAILPSAKKVRTVTIRPDMTVVPRAAASDAEPEPSAAPSARSAEAAAPPARNEVRSPSPAPARPAPTPAPPRQTASAPLSLAPSDVAQSAPAQRVPAQTAAPAPTRQPMALAAAPAAAPNEAAATADGRFTVQVSSQRSEAEAKASYRTLQARYPNVLGGQSSFVRRADLGSRGIYYRTLVGPFATAEQAGQLCGSLKSAGGQCIIHRN